MQEYFVSVTKLPLAGQSSLLLKTSEYTRRMLHKKSKKQTQTHSGPSSDLYKTHSIHKTQSIAHIRASYPF
ncbi:hypothetical protein V495_07351 [Pseudogymnoascus sp. VKM F-4514 (FW-929)]|nr:hypothetical protein V495_07351 [Pseudogymnoascus sp. VKM F-4514 (FW-929)]